MTNKFGEAVAESLRAVESNHRTTEAIAEIVGDLDAAVSVQTNGRVRVKTETRPTGPRIYIFVYVDNEPDRQREVCALQPSRSGFPVEVLSFSSTRTGCPDVESLKHKFLDIVRDARFGLKLNALMSEAQMAELDDGDGDSGDGDSDDGDSGDGDPDPE